MVPEEHLRLLRVFHFILFAFAALALVGLGISTYISTAIGLGPAILAGYGLALVIVVAVGVLNLLAALRLPEGGRRISIAAAIVALLNIPLGTAIGIYALLVHFKFAPESP